MKNKWNYPITALALLALSTINSQLSTARAQGTTAFTYQGRLNTGTNAANGLYDMTFAVYDANVAGNQIAGPITNSAVAVSNGLFTVTLDFGPGVFTGTNYWVQMAVSPAGARDFCHAGAAPAVDARAVCAVCPVASVTAGQCAMPAGLQWWPFAEPTCPPAGCCAMALVNRTTYANLFAAIGTAWGIGDGPTTFNLPDMRGNFLRGVDPGIGQDPDAASRTALPTTTAVIQAMPWAVIRRIMYASHNHAISWLPIDR